MARLRRPDGSSVCPTRRSLLKASAGLTLLASTGARAQQVDVALAGIAFAGDEASSKARFRYSLDYLATLKTGGTLPYARVVDAVSRNPPRQFHVVAQIDELKGRDQAIAVALVIGSETISVERLAGLHKLFVLIRAQALFFDFKSLAVIRAYPISFAAIDVLDRAPTDDEIRQRVRGVFEGAAGKPGIFTRFGTALGGATLPSTTSRTLQVTRVAIKPEASGSIPAYLSATPAVAETWMADLVGEALSTRTGVPVVPYAKGYAIGNVMSMRISDGDVYNLKLPKPDYEIGVDLSAFRKVEYGKAAAGSSFIYGAYVALKIEEPLSGKVYLDTVLKNGEIKLVPVTQTYVDDFPAYYDSVNGLFVKLTDALNGKGNDWVHSAAAAPDIDQQIAATRELIRLCK